MEKINVSIRVTDEFLSDLKMQEDIRRMFAENVADQLSTKLYRYRKETITTNYIRYDIEMILTTKEEISQLITDALINEKLGRPIIF